MSGDVHTPLLEQLLDQRVVDLNAVAAAGVVLYDVLRSVPSEVAHLRRPRTTWTTFLRFGIRGLASAILILNASQIGFARTQQFCRAYSFFFPIAIEVLVILAIVFFCVHAAILCSVETRVGAFVLYGMTLALLIAQITTFVLALVLHPPKAVDIPAIPGCVYLSTPHDKFSCFWWPALALEILFVVNAVLHVSGSARPRPTLKNGRIAAAQRSRLAEHVVLSVLLLLQSVFGATGQTAASRSTVWWFVACLSVVVGRMKFDNPVEDDEQRLSAPSPIPPSPTSGRTIRACGAEPSPSLMGGFITMPLPAELRNLSPEADHPRWSSAAPSMSSLQSIPSIATTSIEFAPRRSNEMSPRNSRVDANYDAGRAYIPFARRTPLPDAWRVPV